MNGTTWDLEVKGVKRTKREVREAHQATPHVSSGHLVVPFIDTRHFPRRVRPSLRPQASHWDSRRRLRRGNSHPGHSPSIRHMRGSARRRVLASRLVKGTHRRVRLRNMRMRRGHARPSRETVLDPELQRDFGSIVKVRQDIRESPSGSGATRAVTCIMAILALDLERSCAFLRILVYFSQTALLLHNVGLYILSHNKTICK